MCKGPQWPQWCQVCVPHRSPPCFLVGVSVVLPSSVLVKPRRNHRLGRFGRIPPPTRGGCTPQSCTQAEFVSSRIAKRKQGNYAHPPPLSIEKHLSKWVHESDGLKWNHPPSTMLRSPQETSQSVSLATCSVSVLTHVIKYGLGPSTQLVSFAFVFTEKRNTPTRVRSLRHHTHFGGVSSYFGVPFCWLQRKTTQNPPGPPHGWQIPPLPAIGGSKPRNPFFGLILKAKPKVKPKVRFWEGPKDAPT